MGVDEDFNALLAENQALQERIAELDRYVDELAEDVAERAAELRHMRMYLEKIAYEPEGRANHDSDAGVPHATCVRCWAYAALGFKVATEA